MVENSYIKQYDSQKRSYWKFAGQKSRASVDDHLVKEASFLRKVLQQFILRHPNIIITLSNLKLVGCNHLRFEEEALMK